MAESRLTWSDIFAQIKKQMTPKIKKIGPTSTQSRMEVWI